MIAQDTHFKSLKKATAIAGFQIMDAIAPLDVIKLLNKGRISFVLVGAFGLAGWTKKPRASEDVDVVVAAKHHKKAVKLLLAAFPHLEPVELDVVTRLRDRATTAVAIDVMKPNQQLYREVFKHTARIQSGDQEYRIPSLEMALAMKFSAMISLTRMDADKFQDAADFSRIVLANPGIDPTRLAELGELVYPGGGAELVEKVRQVRAGEKLLL